MTSNVNRRLPRPCTLCLRARNLRTRSKTYWSTLRYALAKVVGPASQRPVQLVAYFGPWIDIARHQKIADPCLEPLHTLLGRARTQIPIPVRLKPMRAERVAEEVEAFLSGVSQRSFRLVDRQPELGHPRLRPR